MSDQRPKNLNLFTIRFPLPAIVSILHRISGVILLLCLPFLLWSLDTSLSSQEGFDSMRNSISSPLIKMAILLFLAPFFYHLVAGIRHLLMDLNIGVGLKGGRLTAALTFVITLVLVMLAGIYLW